MGSEYRLVIPRSCQVALDSIPNGARREALKLFTVLADDPHPPYARQLDEAYADAGLYRKDPGLKRT